MDMRQGFTLIELLVVIAIIALLMGIIVPVVGLVREHGAETVCRSNLRQMTMIMKAYCNDHDNAFPHPTYIYHSEESFKLKHPKKPSEPYYGVQHRWTCRWHDEQIGPDGPLLRRHEKLQGALIPYIGKPQILLCKTGARACEERGCIQDMNEPRRPPPPPRYSGGGRFRRGRGRVRPRRRKPSGTPDPNGPTRMVPQYSYTMNGHLHRTLRTGSFAEGSLSEIDVRTFRTTIIRKETHVTRSPSEVFAFGEENSWPINKKKNSRWRAPYNLSGPWGGSPDGNMNPPAGKNMPKFRVTGALTVGSLDIGPSYTIFDSPSNRPRASRMPEGDVGDAFATYHRPRGGDLNTGHSYVSMLDGHVRKVTVADQLRASRRDPNLPESRLGPGGNLHLAWPLDTPPLCGWENQ